MSEIEQEFVEFIVKSIVEKPDNVEIKRTLDKKGVFLELTVDPEDVGKIIGKKGATINAIRALLRVLGAKNDARYSLKVIEPEGSEQREVAPEEPAEEEPEEAKAEDKEPEKEVSDIKAKAKEGLEGLDDLDI